MKAIILNESVNSDKEPNKNINSSKIVKPLLSLLNKNQNSINLTDLFSVLKGNEIQIKEVNAGYIFNGIYEHEFVLKDNKVRRVFSKMQPRNKDPHAKITLYLSKETYQDENDENQWHLYRDSKIQQILIFPKTNK